MSQLGMPTPPRPRAFSRRPVAKEASASSSFSDDEDAITPCSSPPPEPQQVAMLDEPQPRSSRFSFRTASNPAASPASSKISSSQGWHFDPTDGEDIDNAQLWRRMLEIQRVFHCYNSARMAAALLEFDMGADVGRFAPSRSCLDLLNDSITDIPEVDRTRLVEWLHENPAKHLRRKRSGIWKRNMVF